MKILPVLLGLLFLNFTAAAQFEKASLQASGLTCSMCSKAVLAALQKLPFVEKVQVDIKNQQYNIQFKPGESFEFDDLSKAVEDAGFSVASLSVSASVSDLKVEKDKHLTIGNKNLHFLNAAGQQLNGSTSFKLVDKSFVTAKEFKKYSNLSKMKCVQTGKMENCCTKDATGSGRVYHVVI